MAKHALKIWWDEHGTIFKVYVYIKHKKISGSTSEHFRGIVKLTVKKVRFKFSFGIKALWKSGTEKVWKYIFNEATPCGAYTHNFMFVFILDPGFDKPVPSKLSAQWNQISI